MESSRGEISAVVSHAEFIQFAKAFSQATGLPVLLESVACEHSPLASPNCASCVGCSTFRHELFQGLGSSPLTRSCPMQLFETAVPVPQAGSFTPRAALVTGGFTIGPRRSSPSPRGTLRSVTWEQLAQAVTSLQIFIPHLQALLDQASSVAPSEAIHPAVHRSMELIREKFCEPLTLGEVSKRVGVHPDYLSRLFSKETGCSFRDYLTRFRLEAARKLLGDRHARVTETAFACGFQSISQFNRAFRDHYGASPSEFRHLIEETSTISEFAQ